MSQLNQQVLQGVQSVYMIGIGGVGMSGLARVLAGQGLSVAGSDARESLGTKRLQEEGIQVTIQPKQVSFEEIDLVIYSSAIRATVLLYSRDPMTASESWSIWLCRL